MSAVSGVVTAQSTAANADAPEPIVWDLSHVLEAAEGPALKAKLDDLETRVKAVEARRGKLDETITTPQDLLALIDEVVAIDELADRLGAYGSLEFAADTSNQQAKSLMGRIDRVTTDVGNRIRFFSLWWKNLDAERAESLMPDDPEIRYWLERIRAFRPHTLSEDEERVISIKDVTGGVAIDRLREILTSSYRYKDPKTGELVTQSELTRYVHSPDPALREGAYHSLWDVYREHESELAYMYETVVNDWASEYIDLRGYASPIAVRNKMNDLPDEAVETVLDVCRENRGLFQRYFEWKGKQLDLEMSRYHIYAPLSKDELEIPYEDAKQRVLDVFEGFSPDIARKAKRVFDENHVHVYPGPNKRGGAFCATVTSTLTPYVFMNYTGDSTSVKTLAHEMGHAVHSLLAEERFPMVAHSTLPLAETASVFSEMLLHDHMIKDADAKTRQHLLSDKLSEAYATIMRQAYFVHFEKEAHRMIREGATADDLNKVYLEQLREQLGPIHVPDDFQREWTYIPHIYASPFYCYSYSFGMLLSLGLYARYREEGEAFVPKYIELLAAGGSASPETILAKVGVDPKDRSFWQKGFGVLEEMMRELEKS